MKLRAKSMDDSWTVRPHLFLCIQVKTYWLEQYIPTEIWETIGMWSVTFIMSEDIEFANKKMVEIIFLYYIRLLYRHAMRHLNRC